MSINFASLYYREPYCYHFESTVVSCEGPYKDGTYRIELEESAFYPEGGGQPGDRGTLGEAVVLDTVFEGERHVQVCDKPLSVGSQVAGDIDFSRRFELMQQHTGEHLISGLARQKHGVTNVGFHINETEMTLDFDKELSVADCVELEDKVNEVVFQNLPVEVFFPPMEELEQLDYRSKIEINGPVRLINVKGVDSCACCGTHLRTTGEIGLIKIVDRIKYKGGVRLTALCGKRALRDYQSLSTQAEGLSRIYSLKSRELLPELERPLLQISELENDLEKRHRSLAQSFFGQAEDKYLLWFDDVLDKKSQKVIVKWVAENGCKACFSFVPLENEKNQYRYLFNAESEDLGTIQNSLSEKFTCRGGGRKSFFQGQIEAEKSELITFFEEFSDTLEVIDTTVVE